MDIKNHTITEANRNFTLQMSKIEQKSMFVQLPGVTDKTISYNSSVFFSLYSLLYNSVLHHPWDRAMSLLRNSESMIHQSVSSTASD